MARARNIKPGYFKNEELAECEPLARILFAGLWCEADRAGRLEDRPRRLKIAILPYDNCDCDALLAQLAARGFIQRYEVDGQRYIEIPGFHSHQNPHRNEAPSVIPSCPEQDDSGTSTVQAQCKSSAESEPVPTKAGIARADSLIPSSLIPSSLIAGEELTPPSGGVVVGEPPDDSPPPLELGMQSPAPKVPDCPHVEIVAEYHRILPMCPEVREWTAKRRAHLQARWKGRRERQTLSWWTGLFQYIADHCPFLIGRIPGSNGRPPFLASLAWLVASDDRLVEVMEGKYFREGSP